jgi:hypothetical protein
MMSKIIFSHPKSYSNKKWFSKKDVKYKSFFILLGEWNSEVEYFEKIRGNNLDIFVNLRTSFLMC